MAYKIKEIFYSLQGEGAQTGRPAVFCRFSGCNLWSGKAEDKPRSFCAWCDTDFVGTDGPRGGIFDKAGELAACVSALFPASGPDTQRLVVATGGEPLLQLDEPLITAFHTAGLEIAVETNGTLPMPTGIDWVCVSPKAGAGLTIRTGDELKLLFSQDRVDPEEYLDLHFRYFFLQPIDGPRVTAHTALAIDYCLRHPRWRLSLQTHKIVGIP